MPRSESGGGENAGRHDTDQQKEEAARLIERTFKSGERHGRNPLSDFKFVTRARGEPERSNSAGRGGSHAPTDLDVA